MIRSLVNILALFFPESVWRLFIFMQQETGLLIGGEHAMSFFTDEPSEADLELFVEYDYREPVVSFIVARGYRFIPFKGQPRDVQEAADTHRDEEDHIAVDAHISFDLPGVKQEEYFVVTLLFRTGEGQRIRLHVTHGTPVQSILRFHSSEYSFWRD